MRKARKFLEAMGEIDDKYIEEARCTKMKKKFSFKPVIAAAACLALIITAYPMAKQFANISGTGVTATTPESVTKLGTSGKFTAYEAGGMQDGYSWSIGNHNIDIDLKLTKGYFKDANKKNLSKTVNFNGAEWTAKYVNSFTQTDFSKSTDKYAAVIDGRSIAFTIDPETGKCKSFLIHKGEENNDTVLTRDELYEIALEFFRNGNYVSDIENYQLVAENSNGETVGYWFRFARVIDGIQTADFIKIGVRWNGEVYMYGESNLGEMKNLDVSGIDIDAFHKEVERKLKTIYGDYFAGYDKNGAMLRRLTNGSYAFDYVVAVDLKNPNNGEIVCEGCYLVIGID